MISFAQATFHAASLVAPDIYDFRCAFCRYDPDAGDGVGGCRVCPEHVPPRLLQTKLVFETGDVRHTGVARIRAWHVPR